MAATVYAVCNQKGTARPAKADSFEGAFSRSQTGNFIKAAGSIRTECMAGPACGTCLIRGGAGVSENRYAVPTMARELGMSRSTIKRALDDLVRAGYVKKEFRYRENGSYTSNLYTLL